MQSEMGRGVIHYRFRSRAEYFQIEIPGDQIPAAHFKRMICQLYHITRDHVRVFQKDSDYEYSDYDSIPSNSVVILRREPFSVPEPILVSIEPSPEPAPIYVMPPDRPYWRQPRDDRMPPVPPAHYVCHRCHRPGHWIKFCPTNGNPEFDIVRRRH